MPDRHVPVRYLRAEDPSFERDCLALKRRSRKEERGVRFADFLSIVKVAEPLQITKREHAVAVIGPVACDACHRSCKKATVLLPAGDKGIELYESLSYDTAKEARTVAHAIGMLSPKKKPRNVPSTNSRSAQQHLKPGAKKPAEPSNKSPFGVEAAEEPSVPFASTNDRIAGQLVDEILDLQTETPVTIGPRGEITPHPDGFQPELDLAFSAEHSVTQGEPPQPPVIQEGTDHQFYWDM